MITTLLAFVLGAAIGAGVERLMVRRRAAAVVARLEQHVAMADSATQDRERGALREHVFLRGVAHGLRAAIEDVTGRRAGARLEPAAARAPGHATHPTDEEAGA